MGRVLAILNLEFGNWGASLASFTVKRRGAVRFIRWSGLETRMRKIRRMRRISLGVAPIAFEAWHPSAPPFRGSCNQLRTVFPGPKE